MSFELIVWSMAVSLATLALSWWQSSRLALFAVGLVGLVGVTWELAGRFRDRRALARYRSLRQLVALQPRELASLKVAGAALERQSSAMMGLAVSVIRDAEGVPSVSAVRVVQGSLALVEELQSASRALVRSGDLEDGFVQLARAAKWRWN